MLKREVWTTSDLVDILMAFAFAGSFSERNGEWQTGYAAALWAVAVAVGVQQELSAALPARMIDRRGS